MQAAHRKPRTAWHKSLTMCEHPSTTWTGKLQVRNKHAIITISSFHFYNELPLNQYAFIFSWLLVDNDKDEGK